MSDEAGPVTLGEVYRAVRETNRKLDAVLAQVADHQTRIGIIEDRGHRAAWLWGGGTGAGVVGLVEAVKVWFK